MVEPPIWKICIKLNQFPYFRDGKNKKSLSCHRPVVFLDRHQRAHLIWSAVQSNLGLELIFSLSLRPLCELRFLLWTMGFFSSSLFDVVWNWKDAGSVRIECVCVSVWLIWYIWDLWWCLFTGLFSCFVCIFAWHEKGCSDSIRSPDAGIAAMWLQSGRDQQWELWFFFDLSYTLYLCIIESLICYVNTNIYKYDWNT